MRTFSRGKYGILGVVFNHVHLLCRCDRYLNKLPLTNSSLLRYIHLPARLVIVPFYIKPTYSPLIWPHEALFIVCTENMAWFNSFRITGSCHSFPSTKDCATSPDLCHAWKSASFLIVLGALLEGITFVAYLAVFNGGYVRKQTGWKVLSFLLLLIGKSALPQLWLI